MCNAEGAEDDWCNVGNGQCFCKDNIVGRQCDHCVEGFYGFPACVGMYVGDKEEGEGSKPGFPYQYCRCKYHIENLYFLKDCGCHADGAIHNKCNDTTGICSCKPHVIGHKCEKCEPGYYGFPNCART